MNDELVPVLPELADREPGRGPHLSERPLRIAQVAPPMEAVPPSGYGGTERIVAELIDELTRRGHEVTLFASGDSTPNCELVPTVPVALRPLGFSGDPTGYLAATIAQVRRRQADFDVIHAHLEWANPWLMRVTTTASVATFHGRLDHPWATDALLDPPPGLVAISRSHAATHPEVPWAGIVYNGLSLEGAPFERRRTDALSFVGRIAPEKGVVDAIEIARLSGRPLRIVAKLGPTPVEQEYAEKVFKPALQRADVEFLGELSGAERDKVLASSYAMLMPGTWPEPFGLVAIEAMACGTPVVARRTGALPEIVRDGIDGFLGDDPANLAFLLDRVDELDREQIRRDVLERFSAGRMVDGYLEVYRLRLSGEGDPSGTNELLRLPNAVHGA